MPIRSLLRLVFVVPLLIGAPTGAPAQPDPLRGLDRYVERAMRAWEVPGLAIAIVHDDSVVYARGFGVRQLGGRDRIDEHTLFPVASTTKPMTAASLGLLVDAGLITWDDPVVRHLPEFRLYDTAASEQVTVRDLLAHRTGLPRGDLLWWSSPYSREEVVHRVRHLRPLWPAGTGFSYQNIMYIAAGQVVESASGTSWDEFLAERLFRPAGMHRSNTSSETLLADSNLATPHGRVEGRVVPIGWRRYDNLGGAGAANSTAWDLAQWVRLVLADGEHSGRRILSDSVMIEMRSPQIAVAVDSVTARFYPEISNRAYGLGWSIQDYRGHTLIQHDGALDGVRAQIALIPEERLGVIVLVNLAPTNLHQAIAFRVLDAYLDGPRRDWSRDLLAAARRRWEQTERRENHRERARIVGTQPSLPLQRYTGVYQDSLYGEMRVERDSAGALVVRFGHLWAGELEHWHFNTFRVHWQDRSMGRSFLNFTIAPQGRVRMMSLEEFGDFGRASDSGGSGDSARRPGSSAGAGY